ncbi:hypothetical protein PLESTB_001543900 [Pleodorina starrii]|uniref:Uncharacterized protein n=1 Tax=Pleodorina starrii TaxID=330485 RepID=A0A9W6F850_9CHLO|nr:hypothetical protein PLESTB_001543900 [Pleodorina starrii]
MYYKQLKPAHRLRPPEQPGAATAAADSQEQAGAAQRQLMEILSYAAGDWLPSLSRMCPMSQAETETETIVSRAIAATRRVRWQPQDAGGAPEAEAAAAGSAAGSAGDLSPVWAAARGQGSVLGILDLGAATAAAAAAAEEEEEEVKEEEEEEAVLTARACCVVAAVCSLLSSGAAGEDHL